jgi:glycosyltransferase involved in cell wall biosynthesis
MKNIDQIELTIAIPTFNRASYIKELLPELKRQCNDITCSKVQILVINNASTDDTDEYIKNNYIEDISYLKNEINIGADRNFLECIKNAKGKYIWLFGDDEILNTDGVQRVVDSLFEIPDLIISESNFDKNMCFDSYQDLLIYAHEIDPVFPVHHTLITKNIFPVSKFDLNIAYQKISTNYSHMYGMIDILKHSKKIIIFSKNNSAFQVRDNRAAFADPPTNLDKKLVRLCFEIANSLRYNILKKNIWLYYNMRPIYNLIFSKKVKRMLKYINYK